MLKKKTYIENKRQKLVNITLCGFQIFMIIL